MQYQILQTKIIRIGWQTVRRIIREILGVKGWKKPQVGCDLNCNRQKIPLIFFLTIIMKLQKITEADGYKTKHFYLQIQSSS